MSDWKEKLTNKDFQNWLKTALAVIIVKKGIEQYALNTITEFHENALKDIVSAEKIRDGIFCSCCTNESLLKLKTNCPNNICDRVKSKIELSHAHGRPSWKNTQVSRWCQCPWEIAKCYMPPDGYTAAISVTDTDLNGILSVMMNHLEFRNKPFVEDLYTKARQITKDVRHSPDSSMDEKEMNAKLDILIRFLNCPTFSLNNQAGQEALENLKKLKADKLQISTVDITEVLKDYMKQIKANTDDSLQQMEQKKNQYLQEVYEVVSKMKAESSEHLDRLLFAALEKMKNRAEHLNQQIHVSENYDILKAQLKEDLLIFNKKLHSTIPLSPLFERRDTPLSGFYVTPSINCIEHHMSETMRSDIKTEINGLYDIFKTKPCNEIYVTSNAGLGKTVFCKRLVVTWCQAHCQEMSEAKSESEADLQIMQGFEYVFLVPLRDTRPTDCTVDIMILHQIIRSLARSASYNLQFLQSVLTKEKCLIILDGLDEWGHPKEKSCQTLNDIPHRNARENCTVLTTSRTWKFCTLSLSTNQIDVHVQITELGEKAAGKLVENAVLKLGVERIDIDDFYTKMQKENVSKFKGVPLILIHLIHLWSKHCKFGDSYCKIFSNIVELHLHRAEIKKTISSPAAKKQDCDMPRCISNFPYCVAFYDDVLKSLGRLAFETYFDINRESSLVFDVNIAQDYLGERFKFCLSTGLLTQNKSSADDLCEDTSRIEFAHKTFQEYFAALYMHTNIDIQVHMKKVMAVCKDEKDILSVSQFYIFLCGFCPEIAGQLSLDFHQIIVGSKTVTGYRSDMGSWNYFVGYNEKIKSLQTVLLDGANESEDNGHEPIDFRTDDIIIDSDFQSERYSKTLKRAMQRNGKHVKSVKIRDVTTRGAFSDITKMLREGGEIFLEKLDVKCEICEESLEKLLQGSVHTMKCFIIKGGRWINNHWCHNHVSLSNRSLQIIWKMKQLEELYLRNIEMTHGQLELLIDYVSKHPHMKHIGLGFFKCKRHDYSCTGIKLDLSHHSQLKMLEIGSIPITEIQLNTQSLEVCYVGDFEHSCVLSAIFSSLTTAEKLHVFCCGFLTAERDIDRMLNIVPFLTKLQHIWLINMNLGSKTVRLSRSMVNIENVFMIRVQMTVDTIKKLAGDASAIERTVRVGLFDCSIDSPDEYVYEREINSIKQSQNIRVVQEDTKDHKDFVFRTVRQT